MKPVGKVFLICSRAWVEKETQFISSPLHTFYLKHPKISLELSLYCLLSDGLGHGQLAIELRRPDGYASWTTLSRMKLLAMDWKVNDRLNDVEYSCVMEDVRFPALNDLYEFHLMWNYLSIASYPVRVLELT